MRNRQLVGIEALVRWNHPDRGLLTPESFIDLAEEPGLIAPRATGFCATPAANGNTGRKLAACPCAWRSISPAASSRATVWQTIFRPSSRIPACPPQCLELEITEGTLMQNAASADRILRQLKELGVQLGIDDFGTGYFSLAYLQNLPIDRLKIDPSFVQGGPGDTNHASIVTTIIDLARNMDLQLIAEGVESASQIDFLLKKGCHIGQGYYFAEPLDSNGIESLIDRLPAVSHGADNLRPYLSNRANNY